MNTKPNQGVAFVEGRFVPIEDAKISVLDWGFTRSDATYDVVHVWRGQFFRLEDHLDRFERSLRALRLSAGMTRQEIARVLHGCVARAGLEAAYVAMVATRGRPRVHGSRRPADCKNTFLAYAIPWIDVITEEVQQRGAHLAIASLPRIGSASVDPRVKNYHWGDLTRAVVEANDLGFDTAVLLDADGFVTEGPGFNVFVVKDGRVMTPDRGALEGITRQSVLELCDEVGVPAAVLPLGRDDLMEADEAFCTTTAGGVMPVSRIENHVMSNDAPGPLSIRLKRLYWEKKAAGWHGTPVDYAAVG